MSSKKEEERNEKIIRGLMKLPPNRRCINCNSLGPQYVCTNFWTFICITCSGIHREFTHRVKSVSMAKFTSQEVESLQRGGNQRAREIFLRDWDLQRQRLPSGSSVEKVREFIKHVYVDRKYAGGNTSEKPPKDVQTLRNLEDDTRRASSYHSYSQSPPYEHQYEDRKYGRVLTRRPGSDRGHYEGKLSSFYSPGRLGEKMYEDRFANEGSVSRASDYSVSSGGDPFRSDNQSPNFEKDIRGSSPPVLPVRDILVEDAQHRARSTYSVANAKRDPDRTAQPQRTASVGSIGSFASNSMSLKSVNSGGLFDVVSEPEQSTGTQLDRMSTVPSLPQSYVSANNVNVDSFNSSLIQQSATFPIPSIDFFQPQATSSTPPIDLFAAINPQQLSTTSFEQNQPALSFADNEGWATFDLPHHEVSVPETKNVTPTSMALVDALPFGNFDAPSINGNMQWPSVQSSTAHGLFSTLDNQWHGASHKVQASTATTSTESWNAFEDSPSTLPQASIATPIPKNEVHAPAYKPSSVQSSTTHGPFSSLDNQWHGGSHEVQASTGTTSTESWNAFEDSPGTLPQASIATLSQQKEVQVPAYKPPSVQSSTAHGPFSSLDNQWHVDSREVQASTDTTSTESWNAFEESPSSLPQASIATSSDKNEAHIPAYKPPSNADQHLSSKISEDTTKDTVQRANLEDRPLVPNTPFNGVINGSSFTPSVFSFMGGMPAHANDRRSINPFDLPYEADLEPTNMFLDMSSLQSALPDIQLQPSFLSGLSEPWLPQNSVTPYIPATPQDSLGGLSYMAGEAPGHQLPNIPAPGPVASLGGNPFA